MDESPVPPGPVSEVEYVRIGPRQDGQRLDNFLLTHCKGVARSHLYRVLRRGEVRVNRGRVRPGYRLRAGDSVRIPPRLNAVSPRPADLAPERQKRDLAAAVLFEDAHLLAIDKPAGLAVHGGSGLRFGLIEAMRQLRPDIELELVHRLDRETSGCLLLAKRRSALRELHQLLRDREIEKRYLALLTGVLPRREQIVDAPLRKNQLRGGERLVCVDAVCGKPARTLFRRLRTWEGLTLAEVRLVTGKTHQIRVHAAHLGMPLAGDEKYGHSRINQALRARGLRRLFLHAATLSLHPGYRQTPLRIEAPLPADLERFLPQLG